MPRAEFGLSQREKSLQHLSGSKLNKPSPGLERSKHFRRVPGQCLDSAHFQLLQDGEDDSAEHGGHMEEDEKDLMRERIAKRLKKDASASVKSAGDGEKKPASRR